MSDRKQVSRKKTIASNSSNPSLAPNIPSLPTPSHNLGGESHQTTPQTVQLETSQKQELTVEQQENQENIGLNESAFDNTNYLQNVSFIPRYSVQRQELEEEKEKHKESSGVIQTKLDVSEPGDKQEGVSIWNKAFQIQRSEDSKLDKPIESFNYLEKATIFRPQETVQRQEESEKEEDFPQIQTKLNISQPEGKQESLSVEDNGEKSPNEETNTVETNSGQNSQNNQKTAPQQTVNQDINQENKATTPETTSQETAPGSPDSDLDFQGVVTKAKGVANKEKQHAPAGTKAQEAQNAAQSPTSELESKAQGNQVCEMEQAPTPAFDAPAFKAKLMERIKETIPKNLDEADKFKDNNKLGAVKNQMQDKVKQEQTASQTPLEEKTQQAPDSSGIEPKLVTPLPANEPGAATQNIGAQKAVPKPKGQNEVEAPLQQSSQQLNQQMADANVTEEQLAKSNEPEFQNALSTKQEADTNANQAPKQYRQFEENQLTKAKGEASATAQEKLQGMHGNRAQLLSQVTNQQLVTKGKDEQERAKIAGDIQNIYQQTKTKVEKTLNAIDSQVEKAFDSGAAEAQKAFEDYVDKQMKAYKEERYSGLRGKGRWVRDLFLDLPPQVNVFYEKGRQLYLKTMDVVLDKIVNIIGTALTNAKAEIANGRKRIQQYVSQLPQNLKALGQKAATDIQNQFDELEQSVDSKQDELINTLAQKYNEKLQAVDSRIQELKAANQGLVSQAANAITGVINTINKLKEMLLSVLSKAGDVIGNIIQDPIGFLGNLISGIKQGFENFVGNIWEHLQSGLIGWLTGTLGPMGIQLPDDIFSLPGIFSLVTQILGLTFNDIRAKAVKRFGEPIVAGMEQSVEVFQLLRDHGAMGLWEYVKEQFNDLKETVIGEIKNMVITQVITAGVKWIIGLLNPASAFVKAAMAIYDIIMFFVNRGSQVLELVNSVVDAVAAIASGAVGGAAKLVENALSKSLPVVIGFLASLLGIGGLAKKVEKIIGRVRHRIDKAIDKVLLKAKGLFKPKKGKGNKDKGNKDKGNKDKGSDGESIAIPFSMNGVSHTLTLVSGSNAQVLMASKNPGLLSNKISIAINKLNKNKNNTPEVAERITELEKIKTKAIKVEGLLDDEKKKINQEGIKLTTVISQYGDKYDMKDITGALELYPAPVVGLYNEIRNDKTPPPDGTTREAHHAPPLELAKTLSTELLNASDTFSNKDIVLADDPFEKAANNIDSAGDNLPAILVHASTHRVKGAGSRIHGSEIRAELTKRLEKDKISQEEAITTSRNQVVVKAGNKAYKRYIDKKVKSKLQDGDIDAIKLAFRQAYNGAAMQTLHQVEIALESSKVDGSEKDRKAAVKSLKAKANEVWKHQLLQPLY